MLELSFAAYNNSEFWFQEGIFLLHLEKFGYLLLVQKAVKSGTVRSAILKLLSLVSFAPASETDDMILARYQRKIFESL